MDAVVTAGLRKSYGAHEVLHGVDLRVPGGALYGFLGPNGAGKTTTIRILLGLLRSCGGSARVLGRDCWRDGPAVRATVGCLLRLRLKQYGSQRDRALPLIAGRQRHRIAVIIGRVDVVLDCWVGGYVDDAIGVSDQKTFQADTLQQLELGCVRDRENDRVACVVCVPAATIERGWRR